jgi:hypothetical protein
MIYKESTDEHVSAEPYLEFLRGVEALMFFISQAL